MSVVVRRLAYAPNRSYKTYSTYIENAPPEVAANTMLSLVHQANYLIDQHIRHLEQAFLKEGGFTERLYNARQKARQNRSYPSNSPAPKSKPPKPNPPRKT